MQRKEFVALLRNLFFFSRLWSVFAAIDTEDDRRINGTELQKGLEKLGLSDDDVKTAFNEMDANNGGLHFVPRS